MRKLLTLLAAAALTGGCAAAAGSAPDAAPSPPAPVAAPSGDGSNVLTVTIHRTPSCTCCGSYEEYLREHGVDVDVVTHDDVAAVKDGFRIPDSERSCHTNEVAGYAVEGHVPIEAVEDLLRRAPDVDGIALAGMPAGSPGMPGPKAEPLVVTLVDDGQVVGELGSY